MKKIITLLLSALLFCSMLIGVVGCKESQTDTDDDNRIDAYVALDVYELTLKVGETYTLDVKKYDTNDTVQEIKEISYTSDYATIAEVEDGVITAKQKGDTYINVYADGFSVACFVRVIPADTLNGLVIQINTDNLYQNITQQAYAVLYDEGELIAELTGIWSVSNEEICSVSENGCLNPKQLTDSVILSVSCEYNGKTYTAEKTLAVKEPIYYSWSKPNITIASNQTLSGVENTKHTQAEFSLNQVNLLTGEKQTLSTSEYEVEIVDERVATCEKAENVVRVNGKNVGETVIKAKLNRTGDYISNKIEVWNAVATIADMDVLALACYKQASLLKEKFVLVDDIDYAGDVIMPIAPFDDNAGKRSLGIQWKYRLEKTDNGYAFVNRADFGKAGTGLTDKEFIELAGIGGLNKNNASQFSGTFDGNGYSIKNGKLFYGVTTMNQDANSYYASYANVFGLFKGTLKNISFENIGVQNPADIVIEDSEYGLDRMYISGDTFIDGALKKDTDGSYYHKVASIIGKGTGCIVENVYLEMRETEVAFSNDGRMGAVVCWIAGATDIKNCVADIQMKAPVATRIYAFTGTGNSDNAKYSNNLSVGAANVVEAWTSAHCGRDGNWWTTSTDWSNLWDESVGSSATNVQDIATVVASYEERIWDMSNFLTSNGRPSLKKGCSTS